MKFRSEKIETPGGFVEVGTVTGPQGQECSAMGAAVSAGHIAAYPAGKLGALCGILKDWSGEWIGTWHVISSRPAVFFGHLSHWGGTYYYMRGRVNGRDYSLRGFGVGMLATGKALQVAP